MQNLELVKERGIRFIKKTFRLPAIGWSAKDGVRTGTVCAIYGELMPQRLEG
jgi:hypothetical protein